MYPAHHLVHITAVELSTGAVTPFTERCDSGGAGPKERINHEVSRLRPSPHHALQHDWRLRRGTPSTMVSAGGVVHNAPHAV